MAKIFVAMSGGVDSSVTAALLKEAGHEVRGVYLKVWSPDLEDVMGECPWEDDVAAVTAVGKHLGIPTEVWDVSKEYFDNVIEYFFAEYKAGRTPNPDILCNSTMKFGLFLDRALEQDADAIATGHYARVCACDRGACHGIPLREHSDCSSGSSHSSLTRDSLRDQAIAARDVPQSEPRATRSTSVKHFVLCTGKDKEKDQSYFLYRLTQNQLKYTLFPIGEYEKGEVREMAKKFGLPNADRKDSQGVCFIGKIPVKEFLKTRLPEKKGKLVTTDGEVIGEHEGVQFFTIGQRHGIGSPGGGVPYFVVEKDLVKNLVIVAKGEGHPSLFARELEVEKPHWISGKAPKLPLDCSARIRYRQPVQRCRVEPLTNADKTQTNADDGLRESASSPQQSALQVIFNKPQRAVAPGQAIVFYKGDEVLGGGVIKE